MDALVPPLRVSVEGVESLEKRRRGRAIWSSKVVAPAVTESAVWWHGRLMRPGVNCTSHEPF